MCTTATTAAATTSATEVVETSPHSHSLENSNDSSGESNGSGVNSVHSGSEPSAHLADGALIDSPETTEITVNEYGPNLKVLECNSQVAELLTIIRDKNTSRSDFKFYADRLIRLVIEESLNQLPYSDCSVETPTGAIYDGLKYRSGNCGVSIIRSGEAMEQGLRDCCRSIRIGKILVESDAETHVARVVYARFPDDIDRRQVLLMYPIMSTGNTVLQAVNVLKAHGVPESCIILSNLFCTPMAAKTVVGAFPKLKILTSELHPVAPNHFGQKYFGTD